MGKFHADYLLNKKVQRCELTAVSDAFPANPRTTGNSAPSTSEDLIRSGTVDAVIIATPHYLHTTIGIDALQSGLHVLVENRSPSTRPIRTADGGASEQQQVSRPCFNCAPTSNTRKSKVVEANWAKSSC